MPNRHLFVLPSGIYRGANIDEINATTTGLREMGLFRLPYDQDVFVQMTASDCMNVEGTPMQDIPGCFVIVGPFGKNEDIDADAVLIRQSTGFYLNLYREAKRTDQETSTIREMIHSTMGLLVVLLATRNIIKSTKQNKLAKLGIGKKSFRNQFTYTTTISVPTDMSDDPDHPGAGSECAPHLRRGHIRRQRFGQGLQYEKKIWIDPVFVNADPDFVNNRAAYNLKGSA